MSLKKYELWDSMFGDEAAEMREAKDGDWYWASDVDKRIEELEKDRERLEWMMFGEDYREFIDAAMEAEEG